MAGWLADRVLYWFTNLEKTGPHHWTNIMNTREEKKRKEEEKKLHFQQSLPIYFHLCSQCVYPHIWILAKRLSLFRSLLNSLSSCCFCLVWLVVMMMINGEEWENGSSSSSSSSSSKSSYKNSFSHRKYASMHTYMPICTIRKADQSAESPFHFFLPSLPFPACLPACLFKYPASQQADSQSRFMQKLRKIKLHTYI